MVRVLAHEIAPSVQVNCVFPGTVDTEMECEIAKSGNDADVSMQQQFDYYSMKRLTSPEQMAAGFLYLASIDAAFITRTTLSIVGGIAAGRLAWSLQQEEVGR